MAPARTRLRSPTSSTSASARWPGSARFPPTSCAFGRVSSRSSSPTREAPDSASTDAAMSNSPCASSPSSRTRDTPFPARARCSRPSSGRRGRSSPCSNPICPTQNSCAISAASSPPLPPCSPSPSPPEAPPPRSNPPGSSSPNPPTAASPLRTAALRAVPPRAPSPPRLQPLPRAHPAALPLVSSSSTPSPLAQTPKAMDTSLPPQSQPSPFPEQQPAPSPRLTGKHTAGSAAMLLMLSALLSGLLALVRIKVVNHIFGAGMEQDAYQAAFTLPDLINYFLIGGAASISVITILNRYRESGDEAGGDRALSVILTTMLLVLGAGLLLGELFAPQYIWLFFTGYRHDP